MKTPAGMPLRRNANIHFFHTFTALILVLTVLGQSRLLSQTFALGTDNFLLNGKPFQMISGELHYARIPHEYWRDRLMKARSMGLNTVATYVFWNVHEPRPDEFNFVGEADVAGFVKIAQELGLYVVLRPGPYACAEWDFGGYPSWLLKEHELKVRGKDERFLQASERYLKRLGKELAPLQITHGGPIIMVQVENEYGSFGTDTVYERKIRDMIRRAGFDVPLFTADGPSQCKNACLSGVLPAINGEDNPRSLRDTVKKFNGGKGPFFSPEFYPGWLDHWGEDHSVVSVNDIIGKYDTLLSEGISVSLYMFHGGTNFGFMNGANYGGRYQPQPTSYDYDAPLDEAGLPTPKYFKFRDVIAKHLAKGMVLPALPPLMPMIEISRFDLNDSASIFESLPKPVHATHPLSMEDVGQSHGYILYRTTIQTPIAGKLAIKDLRDYGIVCLNGRKIGSLDRRHKQNSLVLDVTHVPAVVDIFVENGGRINYGHEMLDNRKGITENVTVDGKELTDWDIFPLPMEDVASLRFGTAEALSGPQLYRGVATIERVGDTFLDMRGWGKGCVWVNNHNLGRFWYIGPQQTLYVPGVWLKQGQNEFVVLELEGRGRRSLQGLAHPILNELIPDELKPPLPRRAAGKVQFNADDLVKEGSFAPGDTSQDYRFKARTCRYVCLQSLSSQKNDPFASASELNVLDEKGNVLPRDTWSVFSVDCEEVDAEDGRAENVFDDDPETIWHTLWGKTQPAHPHYLAIDLGELQMISGLRYLPRSGERPGKIKICAIYARQTAFEMRQ